VSSLLLCLLWLGCRADEPAGPADAPGTDGASAPTGATAATGSSTTDTSPTSASEPRHLLMISIDTLRRDALVRYGGEGSMPFLDQLASESLVADDHGACSNWTFHSTACTMRGAYPEDWGFVPGFSLAGPTEPVPDGTPMLATWLGDAGFQSALVSTNKLFSSAHGNAQGFDTVILSPRLGFTPASVAAEEALVQLAALREAERRYVHLHLMEPHQPYDPPVEWLVGLDALPPIAYDLTTKEGHNQALEDISYGRIDPATADNVAAHMRRRYQGELGWLDHQLGELWGTLEADGWLDDTLVVVWTDHGEQFYERGYQAHAWTLFAEENDGLFFLWSNGIEGASHEGPTSSIDIVPTVLERLGVAIPAEVDGLPLGQAPADRPRFALSKGKGGVFQSVQMGSDRLHFGWTDPASAPPFAPYAHGVKRFDRATDPGELVDLAAPGDPRTQELWELLIPRIETVQGISGDAAFLPAGYSLGGP